MSDRMIVYTLTTPPGVDADAFEAFMRESYIPAVLMWPTRTGQVLGLRLWRGVDDTEAEATSFLLQVSFGGLSALQLRVPDDVAAEFESFTTPLHRLAAYNLCAERLGSDG